MIETCRLCRTPLEEVFCDLGAQPVSNHYLDSVAAAAGESYYPLCAYVCRECLLVQLPSSLSATRHFNENYAYFSSYSKSWLEHSERFASDAISRFGLDDDSLVIEAASNDGYLLRFFARCGVPVLGIEPAANVAQVAQTEHGVPTEVRFFGRETARDLVAQGKRANLFCANNVLGHVPDLHDFVAGIAKILAPGGVASLEFPHLLKLIAQRQFDTIYHEHYNYLSLGCVERLFAEHGLVVFGAAELPTHGGSLRLFAARSGEVAPDACFGVEDVRRAERAAGLDRLGIYRGFQDRTSAVKRELLSFLIAEKDAGHRVVAYGAPAKGNTLLNFCGIRTDFIDYTVDLSPHKQGRLLPGSRIPVHAPERLYADRPEVILVLPWNLRRELVAQLADTRRWGCRLYVPIPRLEEVA